MKKIFFILLLLSFFLPSATRAEEKLPIYIFTQTGCPYCAKALSLFDSLQQQYPDLEIKDFDVKKDPSLYTQFSQFAFAYNVTTDTVPIIFIGDRAIVGFQESAIRGAVEVCHISATKCVDPKAYVEKFLQEKGISTEIPSNPQQQTQKIIGWVVIGLAVIGGLTVIINRLR